MPERKIPKLELAEAPGYNKYHLKLEYLITVPDNRKVNCSVSPGLLWGYRPSWFILWFL